MTKRLLNFMGGEKKFDEGTLGPSLATCNDHKWPAGIGESLSVSIGYSSPDFDPAWSSPSGVSIVLYYWKKKKTQL